MQGLRKIPMQACDYKIQIDLHLTPTLDKILDVKEIKSTFTGCNGGKEQWKQDEYIYIQVVFKESFPPY